MQLALITLMLTMSWLPTDSGMALLGTIAAIWATTSLCDLFRQRFFLDVKNEWGIHWRSSLVAFVKWPYFVLACWDAMRARYGDYILTPKGRHTGRAIGFGAVHAAVLIVVGGTWLMHIARGPSPFVPIHIAAAFAVFTSLLAVITATWTFTPANEPRSAAVTRVPLPLELDATTRRIALAIETGGHPVRQSPPARAASEEQIRALG
jgi:hypothetical protein